MAIVCPECEEKIPSNSKECPECGAYIDASVRYNPTRVAILVIALSIILFVAIPAIFRTLFPAETPTTDLGKPVPLKEIQEQVGDDRVIQLLEAGIEPGDEKDGLVSLKWRVKVKNNSSAPLLFDTDVRFLDESGAEVRAEYILETPMEGDGEKTIRRTLKLPRMEADRIKNMRAIVQPVDEFAESDR